MGVIEDTLKSSGFSLLIDQYYEVLNLKCKKDFVLGQFVKGIMVYPPEKPIILDLEHYDPTNEENTTWKAEIYNPNKNYEHRPIYKDKLKNDEFYFLMKGKRRPCIILNRFQSRWNNKNYDEDIYLCAPLYTFKDKHPDEYKLDILKFGIKDCFFLPRATNGILENSTIRFSRIIPLHKSNMEAVTNLSQENKPFKLTDNALKLLHYCIARYLHMDYMMFSDLSNDIATYSELIDESICQL